MEKIRIAVVGVGNCASSLIQGIEYYRGRKPHEAVGLMHWEIGGFNPSDIEVVAAFDIDTRKIGRDVNDAIFAKPNCTTVFCPAMPKTGVKVHMGRVLDGYAEHMKDYEEDYAFMVADEPEPDRDRVAAILRDSEAEILLNYLPVGSEAATAFYAEAALDAGVALVNNIPVFIASNADWAKRFEERGLPLIGDDIKAQLGATITHRTLTDLFRKRGVKLERTYQLNTGGNTDFLNMLNRSRLKSKKESKTEAVGTVIDPSGLTVLSLSSIDPGKTLGDVMRSRLSLRQWEWCGVWFACRHECLLGLNMCCNEWIRLAVSTGSTRMPVRHGLCIGSSLRSLQRRPIPIRFLTDMLAVAMRHLVRADHQRASERGHGPRPGAASARKPPAAGRTEKSRPGESQMWPGATQRTRARC